MAEKMFVGFLGPNYSKSSEKIRFLLFQKKKI